jgi:hypothetical protein
LGVTGLKKSFNTCGIVHFGVVISIYDELKHKWFNKVAKAIRVLSKRIINPPCKQRAGVITVIFTDYLKNNINGNK